MVLIACVDDNKGMLFGGRRQSRDAVVCADILEDCICKGSSLYIDTYSEKIFKEFDCTNVKINVVTGIGSLATDPDSAEELPFEKDAHIFVENVSPASFEKAADTIILYKWNRDYPYDMQFDIDLQNGNWELSSCCEFAGKSHDKITKEIYTRVDEK